MTRVDFPNPAGAETRVNLRVKPSLRRSARCGRGTSKGGSEVRIAWSSAGYPTSLLPLRCWRNRTPIVTKNGHLGKTHNPSSSRSTSTTPRWDLPSHGGKAGGRARRCVPLDYTPSRRWGNPPWSIPVIPEYSIPLTIVAQNALQGYNRPWRQGNESGMCDKTRCPL